MENKEKTMTAEREQRLARIVASVKELPEIMQEPAMEEFEQVIRVSGSVARKFIKKLEAVRA